jgi:hypothetical protein
MAYLLVFVGIFMLASSFTRGILVETDVEIIVHGNPVMIQQMVEFNELPIVRMTIGMLGLLITMGVPYIAANALEKTWGFSEVKMSKFEFLISMGTFVVFFFALSFIFGVHTIFELWQLPGILFMFLTCVGSYAVSKVLLKYLGNKLNIAQSTANGGMTT